MMYKKYFKNKKVLIAGHTGFKGSWLTLWLNSLDAKILGISKSIPTKPSHFDVLKLSKNIRSKFIDIKHYSKLRKVILNYKPDYIYSLGSPISC